MIRYTFWEIGEHKQETARNEAECERNFKTSCGMCKKQWFCNEEGCSIYRKYKLRLAELKYGEKREYKSADEYTIHTRKYSIAPMKERKRQAVRSFNKLYKTNKLSHRKELLLDEISVKIELGDYESAITLMVRVGLKNTAKKIAPILRKKIFLEKILKEVE